MLWCARLKRIQYSEYPDSLHEGANYVKQAVFSNLFPHSTDPGNKSIPAKGAITLPVTLGGGVMFTI